MTESEKRIREMAEIIEKRRLEASVTAGSFNEGAGMWYAKDLYKKGYRKQSDTAREILDEVSQHFGGAWLVKLYKKYGVEVEE